MFFRIVDYFHATSPGSSFAVWLPLEEYCAAKAQRESPADLASSGVSSSDGNRVRVTVTIVEEQFVGLLPKTLIHIAVEGGDTAWFQRALPRRCQCIYSSGSEIAMKVKIARHPYRCVAEIPHMYFQILIEHLQSTTGLEVQYLFDGRIHDRTDKEHLVLPEAASCHGG
jgi:hypothetical protein